MKKVWFKRTVSLALIAALTFSQFGTSGSNVANAAELSAGVVVLGDADFTGDLWGDGIWTVTPSTWDNTEFKYFTYADDQWMTTNEEEGETSFKFWMQDEGEFTLTQMVDVLPAGEYTLTSYAMGSGADVKITIGEQKSEAVSLEGYNVWSDVNGKFVIDEDLENVAVGFEVDVAADGWGYIDCLKLDSTLKVEDEASTEDTETPEDTEVQEDTEIADITEVNSSDFDWTKTSIVSNGDFESGSTEGWDIVTNEAVAYTVKVDEWASNNTSSILNIYNDADTEEAFSLSQVVAKLPAGTYKLSLDMDGEAKDCGLSVDVNGITKSIGATNGWDSWKTAELAFEIKKDTDVAIKIEGSIPSKYWGDFDNIALYKAGKEESEDTDKDAVDEDTTNEDIAVEADIFVKKVAGVDDDFITGADVSSYLSVINSGAKFYDKEGNVLDEQGFFNLLAAGGTNYIRVRVWNDPYDASGNGYGGGNNDIEAAKVIGQYATKAGMKVLVDFHYSDFWADPGKQKAPKAWASMNVSEKETAIYEYTTKSLEYLLDSGVNVGMVQIGNETTSKFCGESNWENICSLFNAGAKATRDVSEDIMVAIHFTNPERSGNYAKLAKYLDTYSVDYDVFASSYYPYWHGTISNLTSVLKNVADTYGKKVMVAETSWAFSLADGDGHSNTVRKGSNDTNQPYDFSVQGQCNEMREVAAAVAAVGEAGIGMFYWEAAWIPVEYAYDEDGKLLEDVYTSNKEKWEVNGSGWASSYAGGYDPDDAGVWYGGSAVDNQAWFDFDGKALETVNLYKYIRTGTKVKPEITGVDVENITVELKDVDSITLPEKVTVNYNTGDAVECKVVWNEKQVENAIEAGVGEYEIDGTYELDGQEKAVILVLTIKPTNLLINAGFEDGLNNWKVENNYFNTSDAASNSKTGNGCIHFYTGNANVSSSASQTVTVDAGIYSASVFLQGGNSGENDKFGIQVQVGDETYTDYSTVNSWKNWTNPTINNIVVKEDNTELTVSLIISDLTAGVWGSFDDAGLYRVGDYVPDEPVIDEPVVDEPVTDEPVIDEPVTDEPAIDEPDEPVDDKPVVDDGNQNVVHKVIQKVVQTAVAVVTTVVNTVKKVVKTIFGFIFK